MILVRIHLFCVLSPVAILKYFGMILNVTKIITHDTHISNMVADNRQHTTVHFGKRKAFHLLHSSLSISRAFIFFYLMNSCRCNILRCGSRETIFHTTDDKQ